MDQTLILNSRHRHNINDSSCNFKIHFPKMLDSNRISRVIVKSFHCLNLFVNVSEHQRFFFFYTTESNDQFIVSIPVGQYSPDQYLSAIKTAIDSSGATSVQSITLDSFTYQVTIRTEHAIRLLTHLEIVELRSMETSSLNEILGGPHSDVMQFSTTTVCPGILNLSGPDSIHLCSSSLSSGHSFLSDGTPNDCLTVIPINQPYGSPINFAPTDHLLSFIDFGTTHSSLSTIDIQLKNDSNQILDLPTNVHVQIVLLIVFKENE
jgi:hypothetical protein